MRTCTSNRYDRKDSKGITILGHSQTTLTNCSTLLIPYLPPILQVKYLYIPLIFPVPTTYLVLSTYLFKECPLSHLYSIILPNYIYAWLRMITNRYFKGFLNKPFLFHLFIGVKTERGLKRPKEAKKGQKNTCACCWTAAMAAAAKACWLLGIIIPWACGFWISLSAPAPAPGCCAAPLTTWPVTGSM